MPETIAHTNAPRLKFARAIVFLASFCLMTIELLASRVTAPYLGVSLYTWTSVIGSVLLGVTVGNFLGGRLADRAPSRKVLGSTLAFAGLATLALNALAPFFGPMLATSALPFALATMVFACLVFFPAACFLSAVTPQVIKFDLHDLEKTGLTVGTIGAWSAAGSIVGTFATGFLFIAYVGTKHLLIGVAVLLILMGLVIAAQDRLWKTRISVAAALLLAGNIVAPSICQVETNYYCIRANPVVNAAGVTSYNLFLDHLLHSTVTPSRPDRVGYEYEWIQAGLASYLFRADDAFSTLTIGGGGYTMPRYLAATYPNATVQVAEIDPGVTAFNERSLALPRDTRIQTVNMDARLYLSTLDPSTRYDIIYGDAVNDFAVPFQITTREFHALVKRHLAPHGLYAETVIDLPSQGTFTSSLVRTLRLTFAHVYVFPLGSDLAKDTARNTFEIVASDDPFDANRWLATIPRTGDPSFAPSPAMWKRDAAVASDDALERFLASHPAPVLTDDFAPTDNELAPVFVDAYQPKPAQP